MRYGSRNEPTVVPTTSYSKAKRLKSWHELQLSKYACCCLVFIYALTPKLTIYRPSIFGSHCSGYCVATLSSRQFYQLHPAQAVLKARSVRSHLCTIWAVRPWGKTMYCPAVHRDLVINIPLRSSFERIWNQGWREYIGFCDRWIRRLGVHLVVGLGHRYLRNKSWLVVEGSASLLLQWMTVIGRMYVRISVEASQRGSAAVQENLDQG